MPWMRSPRPRRRAQDAGSRWPKTVPAAWKPCGRCERRERRQSSAAARPCSNSTTPSLPHRRKCVTRSATSPACDACVPVRPGGRDAVGYRDPVVATKLSLKYLARRILDLNDEIAELDRFIVPLVEELACQRRSKISPPGRSKTSPLNVMRYAVLGGCPGSP